MHRNMQRSAPEPEIGSALSMDIGPRVPKRRSVAVFSTGLDARPREAKDTKGDAGCQRT
jgi:hypothetical protein